MDVCSIADKSTFVRLSLSSDCVPANSARKAFESFADVRSASARSPRHARRCDRRAASDEWLTWERRWRPVEDRKGQLAHLPIGNPDRFAWLKLIRENYESWSAIDAPAGGATRQTARTTCWKEDWPYWRPSHYHVYAGSNPEVKRGKPHPDSGDCTGEQLGRGVCPIRRLAGWARIAPEHSTRHVRTRTNRSVQSPAGQTAAGILSLYGTSAPESLIDFSSGRAFSAKIMQLAMGPPIWDALCVGF
jgi:hypothetical protein